MSGCTRASSGCDHCYAATMTLRLAAMGQEKYRGLAVRLPSGRAVFNGTIKLDEDALSKPFSWKKPTTVFVNSMSDLFHKDVPTWFIDKVWRVMALTPQHTYQVLTKRPERMATYLSGLWEGKVLPNVWCGTSVENQWAADERIPHLLQVPAAVRFLSCEPLLGPIDLGNYLVCDCCDGTGEKFKTIWQGRKSFVGGTAPCPKCNGKVWRGDLHWIIAGAESGAGARPMDEQWVRLLKEQCVDSHTKFFYKQSAVNGRKQPLPELDGRQWLEMPDVSR